ncbi:hypothetical protein LJR234_004638 [Mesorhizobium amorphae]|uniref:hypothetical protein n=1 Tax=Mesorhizobium amorphae TaxID=71433 RepID=UPI003ECC8424
MEVSRIITTKPLSETAVGELVQFKHGGTLVFGIILGFAANQVARRIVGFLEPLPNNRDRGLSPIDYPTHAEINADRKAISFGMDWVLDPILGDRSWPGNREAFHANGSLVLDGNQYLAFFRSAPDDHEHDDVWFNLNVGAVSDRPPTDMGVPFERWRIWASRDEFSKPGGRHLVEVVAAT